MNCQRNLIALAAWASLCFVPLVWSQVMPELPAELRLESNSMTGTIPIQINYLLYLPPDYEDQPQWPLILFLHGAGERGDDLPLVATHGPPKVAASRKLPFVIVAPQCKAGLGWDARELAALLDDVESRYRIDKDRIYVTGLSMGGFGTWSLGFLIPDRLAALAPVCGGAEPLFAPQVKDVPIWAFHGAVDPVVPLARSEQMLQAVQAVGGNIRLTVYPEVGHDSWNQTYSNPDFYDWLLAQRLSNRLQATQTPSSNRK